MPTGIYAGGYPSDTFRIYRSYFYLLSFLSQTNDVDADGNTFTVWLDRPLNYGIVYVLHDYILPWSSNCYSLDYIVYDCWWFYGFDGIHHAQAYTVNYWQRTPDNINTLTIVQPGFGINEAFFTVQFQPGGYWLPAPYTG